MSAAACRSAPPMPAADSTVRRVAGARDPDRVARAAVPVEDRGADATEVLLRLEVVDGEALRPHRLQLLEQLLDGGDRAGRQARPGDVLEHGAGGLGRQPREDRLAERRRVPAVVLAQLRALADRVRALEHLDEDEVVAVPHAEVDGLLEPVAQP